MSQDYFSGLGDIIAASKKKASFIKSFYDELLTMYSDYSLGMKQITIMEISNFYSESDLDQDTFYVLIMDIFHRFPDSLTSAKSEIFRLAKEINPKLKETTMDDLEEAQKLLR